MHIDEIDEKMRNCSFEYFYWFSRFEFALKERGYLKDKNPGAKAEPDWDDFVKKHKDKYHSSAEAIDLIKLHPKRQKVAEAEKLEWEPVGISHCNNDLCKIVAMIKTVRNNLFHGGKHGDKDVDDLQRNTKLLSLCKKMLDQLYPCEFR